MNIESTKIVTVPWGKLHPRENPVEYHPLLDHCVDVAAVTEALLHLPQWRARLERLAGGVPFSPGQMNSLVLIAGLHDLGKANLGFQRKVIPGAKNTSGHVGEAVGLLCGHDEAAKRIRKGVDGVVGSLGKMAMDLLYAAISHHGKPAKSSGGPAGGAPFSKALWTAAPGLPDPERTLRELVDGLLVGLGGAEGLAPLPDNLNQGFLHGFAGVVMLADWIGSNRAFFAFRVDVQEDRWAFARAAAARVVAEMGLAVDPAARRRGRTLAPADLLAPGLSAWRPAQAAVADLTADGEPSGSLLLIESATGSGKTEAAFIHFLREFDAGRVDGLVFTVPTRAAATQLHSRLVALAGRVWEARAPAVVLGVPGYLRVDGEEAIGRLPDHEVLWPDPEKVNKRGRTWAAEAPKRYLAAPILVCTIDQVLLSGLQVNHAHLRGSALLRQLLVVDEVHASDTYMRELLQGVLRRQVQAGGHVVVMSATLAVEYRERLFAGMFGERPAAPARADCEAAPFPLVVHRQGAQRIVVPLTGGEVDKCVRIEGQAWLQNVGAVVGRVAEALSAGARVLVLRNTVAGCLELQRALERNEGTAAHVFSVKGQAVPHHGRFAPGDRRLLDEALVQRLLENGPVVVAATQTIEQSLDIDFDLLITDLCPLDVLLQRIGRLHRHASRQRPNGYGEPRCVVLVPEEGDLVAWISPDGEVRGANRHGLGKVYADLRVVEQSRREVLKGGVWRIPSENRRLVERALHSEGLMALAAESPLWTKHSQSLWGKDASQKNMATISKLDWEQRFLTEFPGKEEKILTRLGAEDRVAMFAEPFQSPLGVQIRQLPIPHWMVEDQSADFEKAIAEPIPGGHLVRIGTMRFTYSRHGLAKGVEISG